MIVRIVWVYTLLSLLAIQTLGGQIEFQTPEPILAEAPVGGVATPCLRDDELEMFFESSGDLYQALRSHSEVQFTSWKRVTELSTTQYVEERPFLSIDGLRIYFARRISSSRVREIYMASRADTGSAFGTPVSVGPRGTSSFEGYLGSLTGDELKVYLEVIRKVPSGSGTSLTEQTDIACATRENTSAKFGAWTFLSGVNTLDYERDPFITRDESMLLFSRVGPISKLPGTIMYSLRDDSQGGFPAAEGVLGVNTASVVSDDPFLIYPGSRLYFRQGGELVAADRLLEATYSLPQITGVPGWSVLYPVYAATLEEDAQQFDFTLYYDSIYLIWQGVSVAPDLGQEDVEVVEEGSGRLLVSLHTNHPLPNTGAFSPVLYFRFKIGANGVAGQKRSFRLKSGPKINGIVVDTPAAGSIQFLTKPVYPPLSGWRVW